MEYATKGNIAMEGRDGEPCTKEVSGDKACDPIPDLWRDALKGGSACEMNLRRKYYYVTGNEQYTDERQAPDANAFEPHDMTCRSWKPSESLRRATEVCAPNRLCSQRPNLHAVRECHAPRDAIRKSWCPGLLSAMPLAS